MVKDQFKEELEKDLENHRKIVTIAAFMALVFVGALMAASAWYYLTKVNKDPDFKSFFKPQKKQVDIDAENLETYKNESQKISFQYPKDWKVEDKLPKGSQKADVGQALVVKNGRDAINVYINPQAGDFGLSKINVSYDAKIENGIIKLGVRTETEEEDAKGYIILTPRMDREGKQYWFVATGESVGNVEEIEKVFEKIVETFKFG